MFDRFEKNLENLLPPIKRDKIALAVSGGSDSVALLLLADIWAKKNGNNLTVLNLDHGIRPESKEEARLVYSVSRSLGAECVLLSYDFGENFSQEKARDVRYRLFAEFCEKAGISFLLTGHHKDDIIETFLLRKRRKAGVLGSSGAEIFYKGSVRVIRPLSCFFKSELTEYLSSRNIKWSEDSSNKYLKYERNAVREYIGGMGEDFKFGLLREIGENEKKAALLKEELLEVLAKNLSIYEQGFALMDFESTRLASEEIKIATLSFALAIIGGRENIPKASSLKPLLSKLSSKEFFIHTLGGCFIEKLSAKILIYREFGKRKPKKVEAEVGALWDGRFILTEEGYPKGSYIDSLSPEEYKSVKDFLDFSEIKDLTENRQESIALTLPALKKDKKIIALGKISGYNEGRKERESFLFSPGFSSRFTRFF